MQKVMMYTTAVCPFCQRAKMLLASKGVKDIEEIKVDEQPQKLTEMIEQTGRRTVPQIFIGQSHIGGCDDLIALNTAGKLDALLQGTSNT